MEYITEDDELLCAAMEIIRQHHGDDPKKDAFAKAVTLHGQGDNDGAMYWTRVGTLIDSLVEGMPVISVH